TLFVGEQDDETELNLGFFLQLNVLDGSHKNNVRFEIKNWHQLKLNGEQSPQIPYEGSMASSSVLIIVDPSVHEIQLTSEERNLFEASSGLRQINDDNFVDDLGDVVLVLEIK
ncbi:MAG: hypothetical protein AAF203_09505, partial [Pseudomonadota bacterium]